jgi:sugar lactone lactonase YvrE
MTIYLKDKNKERSGLMKKLIALALIASGLWCLNATAQTVGLVITNGLFEPYGVAVDGTNNAYVTDSANTDDGNRVVQYIQDTGATTNFAGGFFSPEGIVFVPARNGFVVADTGNHALRLVSALNGTVSLLAGGTLGTNDAVLGTDAQFDSPAGLAADASGNVYIADLNNNRIRKLSLANSVTTVATGFYRPSAVAVDDLGRILVADSGNHSIKMIDLSGTVTLIAGSGSSFLSGLKNATPATKALFLNPRGLLWVGGKVGLLVSDTGNHVVRQLNLNASGQWQATTFASGFVDPMGLAVDNDGNYLVADLGDHTLKSIQVTVPQPPIAPPIIGQVTFVKDAFGDQVTKLLPVNNSTYNNDIVVAILSESGTQTFYTKGANAGALLDPSSGLGFSPPDYADGLSDAPPTIILPSSDGPDTTIKAIGTNPGRRPSPVVSARFQFQVANPSILGKNPAAFTLLETTEGAQLWYTVDGTDPVPNTSNATLYEPDINPNLYIVNGILDVDFRVRAFKNGYTPSLVMQQTFHFSDLQTSSIGVTRDFNAGIGSTIVIPIQVKLGTSVGLRSLQFRVEVTPTAASQPPILDQFRALNIDPTNDFIRVSLGAADSSKLVTFNYNPYTLTKNGLTTRGLAVSFIGTNANLSVSDFSTIALVAVPIPPSANQGDKYTVSLLYPSGTSDAVQSPVYLLPLRDRTITVNNIAYLVGDTAVADWYNAGDFGSLKGNGTSIANLDNADVNNAFYASLGVRVPFPFTDVFDAMDAFPLDSTVAAGGDGQIRFLDWQVILERSLRLDTDNWMRSWSAGGVRVPVKKDLTGVAGQSPVERLSFTDNGVVWIRQALIAARPLENVQPGSTVNVPVYTSVSSGSRVAGLQFRAVIQPDGSAPALTVPAQFIPAASLPGPFTLSGLQETLPANQVVAAWSIVQNPFKPALQGTNSLGTIQFIVPDTARAGQHYTVRFLTSDGAPDLKTQYDFQTLPAVVWVGTAAQIPPATISDEWKTFFFGSVSNPAAVADADPDGDGVPNSVEYLQGTSPVKLRLQTLAADWQSSQQTGFKLRWYARAGEKYVVESSSSLGKTTWTVLASDLMGADAMQEFIAQNIKGAAMFYRVRLQP